MIEFFDILTGKIINHPEDNLIHIERKSDDYILSIPHSGTLIPMKLKHKFNITPLLIFDSDIFTDQVYNLGKGNIIQSRLNRNVVNMNRYRTPVKCNSIPAHLQRDPLHPVALLQEKEFLREDYSQDERTKILSYYDEYHSRIKQEIKKMKQKLGYALLLDCHSMNSTGYKNTPDQGKKRSDFVIGTVEDTSAHTKIISKFHEILKSEAQKHRYTVVKNNPYNGGAITRTYGDPNKNIHAIQLEINKSLYVTEDWKIKQESLKDIQTILEKVFTKTALEATKLHS